MVSFYPGPSKLNPELAHYIQDALAEGILSENHRSSAFLKLHESAVGTIKKHLHIPTTYSIYFVSSATECWEILSQDLTDLKQLHLYNGSFGEKGYQYNKALNATSCFGISFSQEESLPRSSINAFKPEVIHLTHNETSNGTELTAQSLVTIRKEWPQAFITVDATSSLGGQIIDLSQADVWFASVQKCFGLPSGMAVLICSERVVEHCVKAPSLFYNSINKQEEQYRKHQTTHTPNTLGIYLLYKSLQQSPSLLEISTKLKTQANDWYTLLEKHALFQPLIASTDHRSSTVIAVKGETANIERLKKVCRDQGFILGNGYGIFKDTTFRIANFPAHHTDEIKKIQALIAHF